MEDFWADLQSARLPGETSLNLSVSNEGFELFVYSHLLASYLCVSFADGGS